ncbi:hypothetical protein BD410DRAFT_847259 [Rickenella mellea]|uniref:Uncharacterized protein n=1 Tax=Rickenella mellea TaxID=50990 RepID=A0A4Y7PD17_9AGAM|nr:hypothetical protein BD410DRAFT_847259 [Rickenella mellea]
MKASDGFPNVLGTIAQVCYGKKPWHRCLTIANRHPGSEKYDLILAKTELLKRVTACRQLGTSFLSEGDDKSVKAWLSDVQSEVQAASTKFGLEDRLQRVVTRLRQREKVVAILRQAKLDNGLPAPAAVTRGPRQPLQRHNDPYYHAAPIGQERVNQYQQILVREHERMVSDTSTIVP